MTASRREPRARPRRMATILLFCGLLLLSGCATVPDMPPAAVPGAGFRIIMEDNTALNYAVDSEPRGSSVEVVQAIMQKLAWQNPVEVLPGREGYRLAQLQPDVALFSTILTEQNREQFKWVGPIAATEYIFLARRGEAARYRTAGDFRAVRGIATITGHASEQLLRQQGYANLTGGPDFATGLRRLLAGEVALFAVSALDLSQQLSALGVRDDAVAQAGSLSPEMYYIAFSRQTADAVVAQWQDALDELKRSGRFAAIYSRWLPTATPPGIITALTEDYPPLNYLDNGEVKGFAPAVVQAIMAHAGVFEPMHLLPRQSAYALAKLHPNVALFAVTRTPEQESLFHWIGPLARGRQTLYAWRGSALAVPDLAAARQVRLIATVGGWPHEDDLRRDGFTNLVSCTSPAAAVQLLMTGEAQLVLLDNLTLESATRAAQVSPEELAPMLTLGEYELYIALSRGTSAATVRAWREAFAAMQENGNLDRLRRQWLP